MASQIEITARKIAEMNAKTSSSQLNKLLRELRKAVKATEDTEDAEKYREAARNKYGSNEIEIDTDAVVSKGDDDGAFVAAWVWVPDEELNK